MTRDHLPITTQDGIVIDELDDVKSDTESIPLRRYRASEAIGRLPLLLYIHGDGFVTGGLETDDHMCREIALHVPVVVLSIKYRLAPEHPFPAGFTDCLEVIKWARSIWHTNRLILTERQVTSPQSQERINTDLSQGFIMGGTSAGGNFTAGLAHAMLEQGIKPQPTGLLFMASSFCHPDVRPAKYRDRIIR